jgi:hypothetical protein
MFALWLACVGPCPRREISQSSFQQNQKETADRSFQDALLTRTWPLGDIQRLTVDCGQPGADAMAAKLRVLRCAVSLL